MKAYTSNNIRNIAVLGHGGKGKTTLCEAMLYIAGASDRLGRVADGNTVLDFDSEEKRRKSSVSSAIAALEWDNTKLNIIDAPGLFDFEGGAAEAVRAAEAVLIVTSAGSGVDVGTEKAFRAAEKKGAAKFFAVTKTDSDHRNFYKTFDALKEVYGNKLCPTIIPYMEGNITKCYVNLMTGMAFSYDENGKATKVPVPEDSVIEEMTSAFMEAVATTDDALMEKFFEGEKFTKEEILKGLCIGIFDGSIYPVYAVSGLTCAGVDQLLCVVRTRCIRLCRRKMHLRKRRRGYFTLRRKRSARSRLLQDDSRPVCRQDVILQGCFRQARARHRGIQFPHGRNRENG